MLNRLRHAYRAIAFAAIAIAVTTSAPASFASNVQAAVEVPVVVKPVVPASANELPQEISRVINAFVDALGTQVENLKLRESAIAVCWQTHQEKKSPFGESTFYECLVKAAAETGATWDANVETLRQFYEELNKIRDRANEGKTSAAAEERTFAEQHIAKQKQVADARARLELAQQAIARGQTISPQRAAEIRKIADDLSSAHYQAQMLKRQRGFYRDYGDVMGVYAERVQDLAIEIDVMGHFASNRKIVWAAILKTIETEAKMSVVIGQFDRLRDVSEKTLIPTLRALQELGEAKLPALPQIPDAPAQGNWRVPAENLKDLITATLERTKVQ